MEATLIRKKKILVVDDDRGILDAMAALLAEEDFYVVLCDNPDCLDIIHNEEPDLIIMDILMPGSDGYSVAKRIKQDPIIYETPIIAFSANPSLGKIAQEMGIDAFIEKPFTIHQLLKAMEKCRGFSE